MRKRKDTNLAEGEITGHAHRCAGTNVIVYDTDGDRMLEAPNGCDVTHEEHKTIEIPPGEYDAVISKEYDPFEEAAREVLD